jgi:hypothetical protein
MRSIIIAGLCAFALAAPVQLSARSLNGLTVSSQYTGNDIYEIKAAGRGLPSRDEVERRLLIEAARTSLNAGRDWFALLPMPGEATDLPVARPVPTFGTKYSRWHTQWAYKTKGEHWRIWRPEWGTAFWSESIDKSAEIKFEATALLRTGSGQHLYDGELFDARAVMSELGR